VLNRYQRSPLSRPESGSHYTCYQHSGPYEKYCLYDFLQQPHRR
jgi:hypothetical protein